MAIRPALLYRYAQPRRYNIKLGVMGGLARSFRHEIRVRWAIDISLMGVTMLISAGPRHDI